MASVISCSLALFALASVKCQSVALEGLAQWSGGSHHEDRSTLPFETATRNIEREEEESNSAEGEFREGDLHCHCDGTERC